MTKTISLIFSLIVLGTIPFVFADSEHEKIEFAAYLEETLGHFWALEKNLDENNSELALVHATHPIAELYDLMRPQLQKVDPQLDSDIKSTLLDLQNKANTDVTREQAQTAIDDAKELVERARMLVVGDEIGDKTETKLVLMKGLLETSIVEYGEAVSDGIITEMAEFQDGSAFVWRSQQIFDEIKTDIPEHEAEEIEEIYELLWNAYDQRADPTEVDTLAGGIVHEIDEILGIEREENELLAYVETIEDLLTQTKNEYSLGNSDKALSLATKAYLDNYEFIEGPISQSGNPQLMKEVEFMLREELRNMIKANSPSSEVNAKVDLILDKMETIEEIFENAEINLQPSDGSCCGMHMRGHHGMHHSPHMQFKSGVSPSEVICNEGMHLMMKLSNGAPVCLNPSSVERLVARGYCSNF